MKGDPVKFAAAIMQVKGGARGGTTIYEQQKNDSDLSHATAKLESLRNVKSDFC